MQKKVIAIAHAAGKLLMRYYGKTTDHYKTKRVSALSLVTEADYASELLIVRGLQKHFPSHGIFAEEKHRTQLDAEYVWYVDPLDGTSNFTRHIPLFGISIGLTYRKQSVFGVLHFPALRLTVWAEKGKGAFANGKRIHVSHRKLHESLYYGGGFYRGKLNVMRRVSNAAGFTKVISASSYELAQIAMSDAELYILRSVPHDVVAGVAIVEEAGGKVTDRYGKPWTTDAKTIVVSNGVIHRAALRLLQ